MSLEAKAAIAEAIDGYLLAVDEPVNVEDVARYFSLDASWECYMENSTEPYLRFTSLEQLKAALRSPKADSIERTRHHRTGLFFSELTASGAKTVTKVLVTAYSPAHGTRVENIALESGCWTYDGSRWLITAWTVRREIAPSTP